MISFSFSLGNLENFLINCSFLALLLSMIFYWIQTFFPGKIKSLGTLGMILASIFLFGLLVLRWKNSGHFPLSNLYESLVFLSWTFTFIHLILEKITQIPFLGAITSPSALLVSAFATFSLPLDMQQSSPLVPALQSNWLMMHVTVMILSYAALICGSLLSIAFLILYGELPEKEKQKDFNSLNFSSVSNLGDLDLNSENKPADNFSEISTEKLQSKQKGILAQTLDHLSYRILGLGFPFLTIGILSGAVWANEAWGSYWSWDPKETWAFLTWLVFAIYLHTRFSKGWQGKKPAMIASFGFAVVWMCYLGVNLMGEGLHSYGWISS